LGAVGPTPIRARDAENFLGQCGEINETKLLEVARIASEEAKPISDLRASAEYRKQMSRLLVHRSLKQIFEI
jgi:carbon-monoxide dehydrogenase medium subunit